MAPFAAASRMPAAGVPRLPGLGSASSSHGAIARFGAISMIQPLQVPCPCFSAILPPGRGAGFEAPDF
jgi:hypothetical protein